MRLKLFPPRPAGKFISFVFVLFFVLAADASAQTTSTLTGEVRDTNGAVIEGAQVRATNLETGLVRNVQSDGEGRYTFPALPVGAY